MTFDFVPNKLEQIIALYLYVILITAYTIVINCNSNLEAYIR